MPRSERGVATPSPFLRNLSWAEPPTQPYLLVGPLGLRAGWGILLYVIVATILGFALFYGIAGGTGELVRIQADVAAAHSAAQHARATGAAAPSQPQRIGLAAVSESSEAAAVLLAALGLSYLERRRFAVYGLTWRRLQDIVPGALWGLAAMALLIGMLRGLGLLVFDRELLHGHTIAAYGLAWLAVFLMVGIFEEFLFRGYIQFTLMRGLLELARRIAPARERQVAFWLSALTWSSLFFLSHLTNGGENAAGLLSVFLAGILFSYALWRTGSLWWGIGFHMTWDWSQSFLFGVPDSGILSQGRLFATHARGRVLLSGGQAGPEGSLLLIPVLLMIFAILRVHTPAEQPPVQPEPFTGKPLDGHRLESESA